MTEERKVVRVACSIPNGVALRLTRSVEQGIAGSAQQQYGESVKLRGPASPRSDVSPGEEITDVDSEFWAAWLAQNEKSPLVTGRAVRDFDEKPKDEVAAKPAPVKVKSKKDGRAP